MALTDKVEWFVGVTDSGHLEVRRTRVILDNDIELTRINDRNVLNPGEDVTTLPARVRQIAQIVWTPQVIAAWEAKKRSISERLPR